MCSIAEPMCRTGERVCRTGERVCRTGERSRTVLHQSCLITDPSTLRLEATLPFQGSYDAGPVSAVEPSIFKQKKPDLMRVRLFTL